MADLIPVPRGYTCDADFPVLAYRVAGRTIHVLNRAEGIIKRWPLADLAGAQASYDPGRYADWAEVVWGDSTIPEESYY